MQPLPRARSRARHCITSIGAAALATVLCTAGIRAQTPNPTDPRERMRSRFSNLPANLPTSLPAAPTSTQSTPPPAGNALPAPIAATPVSNETPSRRARRAEVTYVDGQLNVRADDSSLNQILRAISRQTGLKITGGVADQRVFGNYGPATTASVLATLLDGTGTNILLLEGDASTPPELTLTPRGGGPTPPNPNSPAFDDTPDPIPAQAPVQQQSFQQPQPRTTQPQPVSGPPSIAQPFNNVNGSPLNTSPTASTLPTTDSVPIDTVPTPSTTPSVSGIVDAPNPPAPGSTTSPLPEGATPEQIYQQLLLMRQKQQQQQSSPPAPQSTNPQ